MIDRGRFLELAEGDRPAVVHVAADLDVDVEPLSAYAALTGRTEGSVGGPTEQSGDAAPTELSGDVGQAELSGDVGQAEPSGDPGSDGGRADVGGDYSFLLESAEKVASSDPDGAFTADSGAGRHARFSFVGYDPAAVVTVGPRRTDVSVLDDRYAGLLDPNGGDTVDRLREALPDVDLRGFPGTERQHLDGGLVGFLAYDAVYDLWLDEVGLARPESRFPDAEFVLNTKTVAFDHARGTVRLVCTPVLREADDAGTVYDDLASEAERVEARLDEADGFETGGFHRDRQVAAPRSEYEDAVRRAKEHVLDGDIYQGVISRTRELYGDVDPLALYRALREVNPSPYMYVLAHDDLTIVGASPETLVSVRGRKVMANPIAGTCTRGSSPVEDRRLAGEMLADGKERAEHTMLVDLARNDVRRVSEAGSVRVEEFMNVLKYSHVQHIESTVTGRLRDGRDAFDATRAAFPAGTLAGAPKIRAMEVIDDLELSPRGPYGGGVGYYSWTGDADFAIVIRTATVEHDVETGRGRADRVTVRAGAGIVSDSDPGGEFEETEQKMDGVLAAIAAIEEPGDPDGPAEPADAEVTGE